MATTNLNTHLWIRIYNGFAIIPDLRQTSIAKNLATFGKKFLWIFLCALLIYLQKGIDSYLLWFFYNRSSNLQRNLKEMYKKVNNSAKKVKKLRKPFLDSHMRNVMSKFRSCRLIGVATIAYSHT